MRTWFMSPELKKALEIHRITAPVGKNDLVFCSKTGNPIDPAKFIQREFDPALTRAGIRKIRFHDLRHTYATLLIAQNENLKFIQSQLGHALITTTIDRYGHFLPNAHHGISTTFILANRANIWPPYLKRRDGNGARKHNGKEDTLHQHSAGRRGKFTSRTSRSGPDEGPRLSSQNAPAGDSTSHADGQVDGQGRATMAGQGGLHFQVLDVATGQVMDVEEI